MPHPRGVTVHQSSGAALAGWRGTWEASMRVSWVVARRPVVGHPPTALTFVALEVTLLVLPPARFMD